MGKVWQDGAEYRTLAGVVLSRFGRIPAAGDYLEWDWAGDIRRFEVFDMDDHRGDKVLVSRVNAPTGSPAEVAASV